MPKYRVETNAGTYEIESDREPTANDVESYLRQSEGVAAPTPATETVAAEVATPTGEVAVAETGAISPAKPKGEFSITETMKQAGWENLSPSERSYLVGQSIPEYFGREILGLGSKAEGLVERSVGPALGQKLGRASGVPFGAQAGGALGGAIGETVAQVRGGEDIRLGAILGAGISGAVTGKPLTGATGAEVAREGAKYAAGNLASAATETLVEEGRVQV